MKNIFDLLSDITHDKTEYILNSEDEFSAYMIQRWISFMSSNHCYLMNEIFNRKHSGFDDQMMMDILKVILPKQKFNYKYVKKIPKDKKVTESVDEFINDVASSLQLPKHQIKDLVKYFPDLTKDYKDKARMTKKLDKKK